jgi:hypothetical protein
VRRLLLDLRDAEMTLTVGNAVHRERLRKPSAPLGDLLRHRQAYLLRKLARRAIFRVT